MKLSLIALVLFSIAARCILILSGIGGFLSSRVEVSTPANSAMVIKEGVFLNMHLPLLSNGSKALPSPYQGDSSRMPPLVIKLFSLLTPIRWTPLASIIFGLPQIAADVATSLLLRGILSQHDESRWTLAGPDGIMTAYLLNPFVILSCVAGTSTPLENLAVVVAVYAAVAGKGLASAFFIALGAYLGVQPLFLIVPTAVLLVGGPGKGMDVTAVSIVSSVLRLMLLTGAFLLLLIFISDQLVASHPPDQCLTQLRQIWNKGSGLNCWATRVYSLHFLIMDGQPNVGVWWYFFLMVFPELRIFFSFVAMALIGAFSIPLAIRFPSQGLFLVVIQVGVSTMLRSYPSVGDLGLYLTLLLLIQETTGGLRQRSFGLLLVSSLLLLSVLGPAMWSQWIDVESANSNFFYSITLVLGIWHVALLSKMTQLKSKEIS